LWLLADGVAADAAWMSVSSWVDKSSRVMKALQLVLVCAAALASAVDSDQGKKSGLD